MSSRTILVAILALPLVLPAACGGGGGGGSGGGKKSGKAFGVRAVDPRDGANALPNDTSPTVFLTTEVEPSTVTQLALFVENDVTGQKHPGTLEISDGKRSVTFHPDPWFDTATTYNVRANGLLRSAEGEPLIRDFESSFSTGPWPSPEPVVQAQFREVPVRMAVGRSSHTSTLLTNGFVLIAGGYTSGTTVTGRAELYDPARDDFLSTASSMAVARGNHTATELVSGLVLIAGGERPGDFRGHRSVELFSPATTRFLDTADMNFERTFHTATRLSDGRVLVTGGRTKDASGNTVWHRSAEIYDPVAETWTRTGSDMEMLRAGHRATPLPDGTVLITGGSGDRTAEIYDPATDRFRSLAAEMDQIRSLHAAVTLPNDIVLLSGGGPLDGELFDPDAEEFLRTSNRDGVKRSAAVAFEFRPGEVLAVGGIDFDASFIHASMVQFVQNYTPTGRYFQIPTLPGNGVVLSDPRAFSAVTELRDGRFLITVGLGPDFNGPDLDTALLFDPAAR